MVLSFIAAISLYSFLLLVQTRNKVPASFGDIGGILFGSSMRMLVLVAITTSQVKKNFVENDIIMPSIFSKSLSLCNYRLVLCVPIWSLLHKVYKP